MNASTHRLSRLLVLFALPTLPASAITIDFREDVRPILSKNCFKCHGGPRAKKDFQMDRPDTLKEHIGPGKYIVPGDPASSEVIRRITMPSGDSNRMPPPREGRPLTSGQVDVIRTWIEEGAYLEPPTEEELAMAEEKPDPDALHVWKSVKGTTLEAYFVRLDGVNVILRSEDGREKPFPIKVFADESKELIQALVQ